MKLREVIGTDFETAVVKGLVVVASPTGGNDIAVYVIAGVPIEEVGDATDRDIVHGRTIARQGNSNIKTAKLEAQKFIRTRTQRIKKIKNKK